LSGSATLLSSLPYVQVPLVVQEKSKPAILIPPYLTLPWVPVAVLVGVPDVVGDGTVELMIGEVGEVGEYAGIEGFCVGTAGVNIVEAGVFGRDIGV